MADSIVRLSVEDSSFNAKIKEAAKAFATFGKNVGSAGVEAFGKFAKGVETAKVAFQGFNQVLKANALVLVSTLAIQAASAIGEMIGDWISGANDAEEAQKKLNDELDRTAQLVKGILAESDFNARIAKAAGKSTSEILQMQYKAADKAYNEAMATMMNPNIKVGTEEYNKANQILQAAEKRRRKLWEDIQVDKTARENKTGEYAVRGGRGSKGRPFDVSKIAFNAGDGVKADPDRYFTSVWSMIGNDNLRKMIGIGTKQWDYGKDITEHDFKNLPGYKEEKETKKLNEKMSTLSSGLSSIAGGLKSIGLDLPKELDQVIGVIQGITSVIEGVNSVISIFSTTTMSANTAALVANTAALWANAGTNLIPFRNGGIVPHAAGGYMVPGTDYSDRTPVLVSSGELILNRAQQGNLASQLQGNGLSGLNLSATVSAEQIRFVLNSNGRRTGRGELVTTRLNV